MKLPNFNKTVKKATGKYDPKEEESKKVTSGTIRIRVFMRFGAEIRQMRAEYNAIEKRDNYNTLVSINEEFLHNEDVDFSQEEVYSGMNITLGLQSLTKEKQIALLDDLISKHKKRIAAIQKHPELNVLANIWDEKRKLREAEIYKRYVQNRSPRGAYFTIESGLRVYSFESIDGFLIPIWHGADNLSDYPDFTRKKKITMQETANLDKYFSNKGTQKLVINSLVLMMIITAVIFIVLLFGSFKVWNMHNEMKEDANRDIYSCMEQTAQTQKVFNDLMRDAVIQDCIKKRNESTEKILPNIKKVETNG